MSQRHKLFAGGLCLALVVSACGDSKDSSTSSTESTTSTTAAAAALSPVKTGPDLRTRLDLLLGEHLILASKATGAALGGRTDEFTQYGTQLNKNGTDIGDLVGAAYGDAAKTQFNSIWSAHNGFFVDYTNGVAKKDKAMQDKAVSDLTTTYVPQFSKFISEATALPLATVTQLTTEHVTDTKAIVDAQAAKDWPAEQKAVRSAYAHMKMIGDPVGQAIAKKFTDKFPGDAGSKAADFRVALNSLLQEHLYLASTATGAALGGRTDEFTAAGTSLNTNGTELGTAIGSIYGAEAQTKFNGIWSAHNGFFVNYTKGVAAGDKAAQDKAVADLTGTYVPQFADFLAGATDLPKATLTSLITEHVLTTKGIVDAQFAKDWAGVASKDRAAAQHMQMMGDPLAEAIVKKNPTKFA